MLDPEPSNERYSADAAGGGHLQWQIARRHRPAPHIGRPSWRGRAYQATLAPIAAWIEINSPRLSIVTRPTSLPSCVTGSV